MNQKIKNKLHSAQEEKMRFGLGKKFTFPFRFAPLIAFSFLVIGVGVVSATALYAPGDTLDPDCAPTDPDCTVSATGDDPLSSTADLPDSLNKRYVTDAGLSVLGNTSGTNTGDLTLGTANGLSLDGQTLSLSTSTLKTLLALVKDDVGLGAVPNIDTTNPANIVQNASYRFVNDTQLTTLASVFDGNIVFDNPTASSSRILVGATVPDNDTASYGAVEVKGYYPGGNRTGGIYAGQLNSVIGFHVGMPMGTQQTSLNLWSYGGGIHLRDAGVAGLPEYMTILSSSGKVGIGTTTPSAKLAVHSTSGDNTPLFVVASSTAGTGTSTAFFVAANGNVGIGTTNPTVTLDVAGNITGYNITGGASTVTSYSKAGYFMPYSWTGDLIFKASEVERMRITNPGLVGIGTSTPSAHLTVWGDGLSTGALANFVNSASSSVFIINEQGDITASGILTVNGTTTGTSTIAGSLDVGGGAMTYDQNTGVTSIASLQTGSLSFEADAGLVSWTDMPITASSSLGTPVGYTAQLGGTAVLGIYGVVTDTAGTVGNLGVMIGATSSLPTAKLSVWGDGTTTNRLADFTNSASTTVFTILENGKIGFGTTTPESTLVISGTAGTNPFTIASSTGATMLTVLQNGNVGVGTTSPSNRLEVDGSGYFTGNLWGANITATGTLAVSGLTTLANASTTNLSVSGLSWFTGTSSFTGNVGIGTSSPLALFTINSTLNNGTALFMVASTTGATTTNYAMIDARGNTAVGNSLYYDADNGQTTIGGLMTGNLNFEDDAGAVSWVDMTLTASSSVDTISSYTANLGGAAVLTIYGVNDGLGGFKTGPFLAVGTNALSPTSTPSAMLTVWGTSTDPIAHFITTGSTTALAITSTGAVGVGTSTPAFNFQVYVDASNEGHVAATGDWARTSDASMKKNVLTLGGALDKVMQLRGVTYDWNNDEGANSSAHIGFIAQEVEAIFPEFVDAGTNGIKGVAYGAFTPVLLQAIKEQQEQILWLTGSASTSVIFGTSTVITTEEIGSVFDYLTERIAGGFALAEELVAKRMTALVGSFDRMFAREATVETLCVGTKEDKTCVTKGQLDALLQQANTTPAPLGSPEPTAEATPTPSETPTPTPCPSEASCEGGETPEPSPTPTETVEPTPTPSAEPEPTPTPCPSEASCEGGEQ